MPQCIKVGGQSPSTMTVWETGLKSLGLGETTLLDILIFAHTVQSSNQKSIAIDSLQ